MAIEVFNRYEHKYILTKQQYARATGVIEKHMTADAYCRGGQPYTISNIYYDTKDDFLIRTSLQSPVYKEKLRLRSYGVPDEDSDVFLEIKKKYRGIVNKRRSAMRLCEARALLGNKNMEITEKMNRQVVREIEYFLSVHPVAPKVYIAYDRIAYFEEGNPDLRISFDMNIRSRRFDTALEKGDYGTPLAGGGEYLMEIKTALSKPLWLCRMLDELEIKRTSFSKYGTEYKRSLAI